MVLGVVPYPAVQLAAVLVLACASAAPLAEDPPSATGSRASIDPAGADRSDAAANVSIHRIEARPIRESSGLVRSRQYDDVFWTHNDSGDSARIFAIDREGALIAQFRIAHVRNRDWEDIAVDDSGRIYIADIGNNLNARRDLVIHVVREPDPHAGNATLPIERSIRFRYPDQDRYPGFGPWNFDAEALLWMDGGLHVMTKHRSDRRSILYRIALPADDEEGVAIPIARFDLRGNQKGRVELFDGEAFEKSWGGMIDPVGNVTAADLHEDGRRLAVLTYGALRLYDVTHERGRLDVRLRRRIPLRFRKTRFAEGVAWDGDALVIGSEQRRLFEIRDPYDPGLERIPP